MSEDIFDDVPTNPGQAFVFLEKYYRNILEHNTHEVSDNSIIERARKRYMSAVIDIARHYDIDNVKSENKPMGADLSWEKFEAFEDVVDGAILQIGLHKSVNSRRYSAPLNSEEKNNIRKYIHLIKLEIDKSELSQDKKDAIFKKLSEIELEIDRDRTRFEVLTEKVLAVARLSGDVEREGARPWWHYIMLIFGEVDAAKEAEKRNLPAPEERKRLEPPKKQLPKPTSEPDDDIPF